jgi:hypothetical protein
MCQCILWSFCKLSHAYKAIVQESADSAQCMHGVSSVNCFHNIYHRGSRFTQLPMYLFSVVCLARGAVASFYWYPVLNWPCDSWICGNIANNLSNITNTITRGLILILPKNNDFLTTVFWQLHSLRISSQWFINSHPWTAWDCLLKNKFSVDY